MLHVYISVSLFFYLACNLQCVCVCVCGGACVRITVYMCGIQFGKSALDFHTNPHCLEINIMLLYIYEKEKDKGM